MGFTLTMQETRRIHDSMNIPKIKFLLKYMYDIASIEIHSTILLLQDVPLWPMRYLLFLGHVIIPFVM